MFVRVRSLALDSGGTALIRVKPIRPEQTESGRNVMSGESILVIIVIGLVAGWLAGQIVRGTGYGLIADICIGIVGAFIASWLFPQLGVRLGSGIIAAIISATIGAVLLLVILRLINRGGRW
jgi:uncharacterized membrane protein YeaQ/YmgE (transglycosylase-associated protein family)